MEPSDSIAGSISSTRNDLVVAVTGLHRSRNRRGSGETLIEGPSVIEEAIGAGVRLVRLLGIPGATLTDLADMAGITAYAVTHEVLAKVSGTKTPRGPVAVIEIPPGDLPREGRVLVAWGVSDPGNCGTLVRTAAAFGYGFVAGPESADPWSPKVLRSAAGGHFHTSIGRVGALEDLGRTDVIGTVPRGGEPPGPIGADAALIVGSEAHGLPDSALAGCTRLVSIPMAGRTESLNAAVAGGIAAFIGGMQALD